MGVEFFALVLLGVTQYLDLEALNILVTVGIMALLLIADFNEAPIVLFVAMPFFNLLNYKVGSISLYYVLIIIFWGKYLQQQGMRFSRTKLLIFLALIFVRAFCRDLKELLTWAALMSLLILLYEEDFFADRIVPLVEYTTYSAVLSSAVGYVMQLGGRSIYIHSYVYTVGAGVTTRFAGLVGDSVFYSQFVALFIALNLVVALHCPKYRWKAYSMSVILTLFDLLTFAKTGILLIAVEVLFYIIVYGRQRNADGIRSAKRVLVSWGVLVVGFLTVLVYVLTHADNAMVNNYLIRFTADDLWTGRGEVVAVYLNLALSNWTTLFVALPQSMYQSGLALNSVLTIRHAHNIFIETICAFGWVTAIVIFIWIIGKIIEFLCRKNRCIYDLMPMAVLLGSGLSLHGHSEWHYYFLVIFVLTFMSKRTSQSWVV